MQIKYTIVRFAEEKDIETISRLERENFQDAWSKKAIQETISNQHAFIVVAEQLSQIIGYCIIYHVLDEGEIARIAVDKTCRRQGVGKQMLDFVKTLSEQQQESSKIMRLLLDVRESNIAARKFYENYGFCEDGIRKNFYDSPREHAVLMKIDFV